MAKIAPPKKTTAIAPPMAILAQGKCLEDKCLEDECIGSTPPGIPGTYPRVDLGASDTMTTKRGERSRSEPL